jgi:hypothetical protein
MTDDFLAAFLYNKFNKEVCMKKQITLILLAMFLVVGCQPSEQSIQTAIAQTQVAITQTQTAMPTAIPRDTPTSTITPTFTPPPTITPVPCLNQSTYGVLDKEKKQVCMQSVYYPCLRWDQVTADMKDNTICVRGIIQKIDIYWVKKWNNSHWDFTDNRTGFFAVSEYLGWHPVTGKHVSVGDCVVIIGTVQVISNGRPYIFWGANSIYKATVKSANTTYFEHPDLWVIEGDTSICQ